MINWKTKDSYLEENSFAFEKTSLVLCANTMLEQADMSRWTVTIGGKKVPIVISQRLGRYKVDMYYDEICIGVLYITYDDKLLLREVREIRINSILD